MRAALALLGLFLLGSPARSAERTMNATDPVAAAARFKGPAGWQRDTGSFGADHFVTYSSGTLRLRVQLMGGKGSRYATTKAFLESPEGKGGDGKPPAGRTLRVGKRPFMMYSRSMSMDIGPQGMGPAGMLRTIDEEFTFARAGRRFFVISLTRTLDVPPEDPLDLAPLKSFLSTFRPR